MDKNDRYHTRIHYTPESREQLIKVIKTHTRECVREIKGDEFSEHDGHIGIDDTENTRRIFDTLSGETIWTASDPTWLPPKKEMTTAISREVATQMVKDFITNAMRQQDLTIEEQEKWWETHEIRPQVINEVMANGKLLHPPQPARKKYDLPTESDYERLHKLQEERRKKEMAKHEFNPHSALDHDGDVIRDGDYSFLYGGGSILPKSSENLYDGFGSHGDIRGQKDDKQVELDLDIDRVMNDLKKGGTL